jgi:hypothetical protein
VRAINTISEAPRADPLQVRWRPPNQDDVRQWVDQLGIEGSQVCLTVRGPNPAYRSATYRLAAQSELHSTALDLSALSYEWPQTSLIGNVGARMDWHQLISALVDGHSLYTAEDLKQVIDQGFVHGGPIIRSVWEAKYLREEGKDREVAILVRALAKWTTGTQDRLMSDEFAILHDLEIPPVPSEAERYDVILLWLTLAAQNRLFDRVILPFDGFDRVATDPKWLEDFESLIQVAKPWAALGSPLGIMLGMRQDPLDLLGDTALARMLQDSMV